MEIRDGQSGSVTVRHNLIDVAAIDVVLFIIVAVYQIASFLILSRVLIDIKGFIGQIRWEPLVRPLDVGVNRLWQGLVNLALLINLQGCVRSLVEPISAGEHSI